MTDLRRVSVLTLAALFLATACTPAGGGPATADPTTTEPGTTPPPGASAPATTAPGSSGSPATPANGTRMTQSWATATLTDVTTGESFAIADLVEAGQVVFVEPMAIWCTNCRRQQQDALSALGQLDRSKVTWLSLDVELSETPEALKDYSRQQGFDFRFAVATRDLAIALADEFGDLVLSPPSTPIIVIGPDGAAELTDFGHKSVDEIIALARARGA